MWEATPQGQEIGKRKMRNEEISDVYMIEIAVMKVKDGIKIIEQDGWFMVRRKGSHRQFRHSKKNGVVTIAGQKNDDLAKGTLNSILKQAGLKNGGQKSV
jgi:predicted RNA binding protein YcfA (HicA-like mRNA interferase family)